MISDLNNLLRNNGVECDEEQLNQFKIYFDLLIEWNQKMNLTAITEPKEVLVKHFYDSITPAFYFPFTNEKIIDVGAGAGFPSIPLKICFPNLRFTLLDSLNKRINFLEEVIDRLSLKNIACIHGRAEELGKNKKHRQNYDIALSRAVAKLNVLSEFSLPFVKLGGNMIALKGSNAEEELIEATNAINVMGGSLKQNHTLELPFDYGLRSIVIIKKARNTPNSYPRKPGTPGKEPIK